MKSEYISINYLRLYLCCSQTNRSIDDLYEMKLNLFTNSESNSMKQIERLICDRNQTNIYSISGQLLKLYRLSDQF